MATIWTRSAVLRGLAAFVLAASLLTGAPSFAAEKKPATTQTPQKKKPVTAKKKAAPKAKAAKEPAGKEPIPAKPAPVAGIVVEPATLSPRDRDILSQALKAAEKRQWPKAMAAVNETKNALLKKIVVWAYLREPGPHASFDERTAFIAANPTWPSLNELKRQAEENIGPSVGPTTLRDWFTANPPLSTDGKVAYARALVALGNIEEAHKLAREAWLGGSFDKNEEREFLREFDRILTSDDHWARVDRILYDEQTTAAERILGLVSKDRADLARARIGLITSRGNPDALVRAVPAALQGDAGLLYDRIKWRIQHDDEDGARTLVPEFASGGPRPDLWWRQRSILARDALQKGRITEAYAIAKHHGSTDPLSVSEAEWFAGWIALRFLKDGEAALPHFTKVYDSVQTPPSLARGAYWTGRAAEHLGRPDIAGEWYARGAVYPTTYYGQLSLARLKGNALPQLPADPAPTQEERNSFESRELTMALRAVLSVDAKSYQRAFALALAATSGLAADRQLTAELVNRHSRPDLGVTLARDAQREKILLVQYGFPVPTYVYPELPEKALTLAITRQESNFDPGALSSAGARGLMQLMPATARGLAKQAKITYTRDKLTTDPAYNIRLGSTYLKSMVEDFNGSYVLAAVSYNAGPGRARQWVRQFGNPQEPGVDPIDWVEMIPFSETRGYVQRVMENMMVYRAILAGTPQVAQNLEAELARHQ